MEGMCTHAVGGVIMNGLRLCGMATTVAMSVSVQTGMLKHQKTGVPC